MLRPLCARQRKCLVLDCDNVLWGGIVGEDGPGGIKIGTTYPGSCYREFQQEVLNLFHRGVAVALCSKNNPQDVHEVLENHPDMLLRPRHVAAMRINWDSKVDNLRQIAQELNIGLDSLVFADDSEFEINLVALGPAGGPDAAPAAGAGGAFPRHSRIVRPVRVAFAD